MKLRKNIKKRKEEILIKRTFTIQWHVTAQCKQKCKHCYMHDEPTYKSEIKNELNYESCLKVLNDFEDLTKTLNIKGRILFTGGDPLLKKNIFKLIQKGKKKNFIMGIMGNPTLITENSAKKLKKIGIKSYQISIDGLEKTHDKIRQKGSFKDSLRALKILKSVDIDTHVMLTLSRENIKEVDKLMEIIGNLGVFVFAFARLVSVGTGKQYKNNQITPKEYRNFLLKIEKKTNELKNKGIQTKFVQKCNLWKLFEYEKPYIDFSKNEKNINSGCAIGTFGLVLLADGTVYACRRFPSYVGKVPKEKLLNIFLHSKKLNKYRNYHLLEKCSKCELLQVCKGCPAVAFGTYGRWTAPDPQCWKKI